MLDQLTSQFLKKSPKERAALLGIVGVGCIVVSVFILFLVNPPERHDKYGCPSSGPVENRIIVIDRTGEIPSSAQRAIRTNIDTIVRTAPIGTRFSIFEIDSKYMRGLSSVLFCMCKMRDGTMASPYNENPELIRRTYERDFHQPLMATLDETLIGSGQDRSPILEALVDVTSVEPFQIPAPMTLYIFSDLLQNTDVYSQYQGIQDFQTAALLPGVSKMIPSLAGANIHLFYLLRSGKELDMQNNTHVQFWLDYFSMANADVKLVKKIR